VYAIATMLYECLSGRPPFTGAGAVDVLIQHAGKPAPDIRSVARETPIPEPLAAVVQQNLEKNPSDRAADARALGRMIAEAMAVSRSVDGRVRAGTTLLGVESGPSSGDVQVARSERKTLRNLGTGGGFRS
jgi:hypothetical protein